MVSFALAGPVKSAPQPDGDRIDLGSSSADLRTPVAATRRETLGGVEVNLPSKITLPLESLKEIMNTDRARGLAILSQSVWAMNFSFPPDERVPVGRFIQEIDKGNYDILVTREEGVVKGVLHQMILNTPEHGRVVAIPYLWASEESRGKGIGSQLLEVGSHVAQALGAWARIAEVNDREAMTRTELRKDGGSLRAGARERFWHKNDFYQLDMPYLVPQLNKTSGPVTYTALMIQILDNPPRPEMLNHRATGMTLDRDVVTAIVGTLHDAIKMKPDAHSNEDAIENTAHLILRRILNRGKDEIALISPHQRRTPFDAEFRQLRYDLK